MNHRNINLWNVFCLINSINTFTCAEGDMKNLVNSTQLTNSFNIFSGIRSLLRRLSGESVLDKTPETRVKNDSDDDKNKNGLMKFGSMIAVVPLLLQILSLPGALASIKVSLLKSLLVGKLALALIIFNALRNAQKTEIVVVHEAHQQHNHYHHPYFDSEDDNHDNDWFGRR